MLVFSRPYDFLLVLAPLRHCPPVPGRTTSGSTIARKHALLSYSSPKQTCKWHNTNAQFTIHGGKNKSTVIIYSVTLLFLVFLFDMLSPLLIFILLPSLQGWHCLSPTPKAGVRGSKRQECIRTSDAVDRTGCLQIGSCPHSSTLLLHLAADGCFRLLRRRARRLCLDTRPCVEGAVVVFVVVVRTCSNRHGLVSLIPMFEFLFPFFFYSPHFLMSLSFDHLSLSIYSLILSHRSLYTQLQLLSCPSLSASNAPTSKIYVYFCTHTPLLLYTHLPPHSLPLA